MSTYDALLLLSFGGPEGLDDVLPFLHRVTAGRAVPPERLAAVVEHYRHFGGVSPINAQNRALIAAIREDFAENGLHMPVYWGNRNWYPLVEDTVAEMRDDGVRRALVFATSACASYSGCRQYRDDLARARAVVGDRAPELVKLRHYFDHPGFVEPHADAVRTALAGLPERRRSSTRLVFTAHSIPATMNETSGAASAGEGRLYERQLRATAELVAVAAPGIGWDLVWQSRSGPPSVPWLEPDINDHLRTLAADGVSDVLISPIGFLSDHLEVVWDLDIEAARTAADLGLGFARAATPWIDPRLVAMVRDLVGECLDPTVPRRALSSLGPAPDLCAPGCCPAPPNRPAVARP